MSGFRVFSFIRILSRGVVVKILQQNLVLFLANTDLFVMLPVDENVIFEAELVKGLRCLSYHVDI